MGKRFPYNSLTRTEEVKLHLHPHWRVLILPVIDGLICLGIVVGAWVILPGGLGGIVLWSLVSVALLAAFVRFVAWPFAVARTTHVVVTTERVLLRNGVFKLDQSDVPLLGLNKVSVRQTLLDRLFRCGTLILGPPSEPSARLRNIPNVVDVQRLTNELIRNDGYKPGVDVPALQKTVGELQEKSSAAMAAPATSDAAEGTAKSA